MHGYICRNRATELLTKQAQSRVAQALWRDQTNGNVCDFLGLPGIFLIRFSSRTSDDGKIAISFTELVPPEDLETDEITGSGFFSQDVRFPIFQVNHILIQLNKYSGEASIIEEINDTTRETTIIRSHPTLSHLIRSTVEIDYIYYEPE